MKDHLLKPPDKQRLWGFRRGKLRRYTDDEWQRLDEIDELEAKLEKLEKDKLVPGDILLIGYSQISKALGVSERHTMRLRHKLEEARVMRKGSDGKWEASLSSCLAWKRNRGK